MWSYLEQHTPAILHKLFSSLPAYAGVYVAWLGLQTWRRQLHGTTNFELARNLTRATIKVQNGIETARLSPLYTGLNANQQQLTKLAELAKSYYDALRK